MTILIGYGTPKKWKGRTMDIYPNSEYDNPNFLWDFDYDFIENMINKGKKETNLKNGIKLVPIYEKAEKQNMRPGGLEPSITVPKTVVISVSLRAHYFPPQRIII